MRKLAVLSLAIIGLMASCGNGHKVGNFKVDNFSNGKAGEVILIMSENQFTEDQKNSIIDILTDQQPAINQVEPMFDLLKFHPKDFTPHFQRHRAIVQFDVDEANPTNQYELNHDVWASPQVVVKIRGNQVDSCLALFKQHQQEIIAQLYDNDLKRLQTVYQGQTDANIAKILKEQFGVQISAPTQYFIADNQTDFLWLRYRTAKNDRFIMVYKVPMTELTKENLVTARNAITKEHIPGAVKNSYPILSNLNNMPYAQPLTIGSKRGMELRGLWESVNDKMGGPFYSFSFLDPSGQYAICIDGFVYAPAEPKRDFLREVEAIVKTVK
ncbi:MAG: DUF4837 family protein [Bacteroidales bacterium]|jgi:hypothetical protein|nr:DUF4837 family protein [Bacteroidales bacterium]